MAKQQMSVTFVEAMRRDFDLNMGETVKTRDGPNTAEISYSHLPADTGREINGVFTIKDGERTLELETAALKGAAGSHEINYKEVRYSEKGMDKPIVIDLEADTPKNKQIACSFRRVIEGFAASIRDADADHPYVDMSLEKVFTGIQHDGTGPGVMREVKRQVELAAAPVGAGPAAVPLRVAAAAPRM